MSTIIEKPVTPQAPENKSRELKDFIAECPLFKGLNEKHQKTLSDCAMLQEFKTDETIFREGDPANRFYLILDGEVALTTPNGENDPISIQKVSGGDVLGWSWLFPPYYWHFDARATQPTQAVFFYGTRLRQICEEDSTLGYELMKRIAAVVIQRLHATGKELLEMTHRQRS